ncbi:MAG: hypothetical protein OHK0046_13580 [Anaerolineae bacterium]
MADDLIGKQIGGYEVLDRVGQGGMATVYRARQNSMNRTVALKILPRHFLWDETYIKRFEREVAIIAQLEHRNIVPVYDYGEHEGQPYIAMRFMPAGSVDDLLKKGPLDQQAALRIIDQIAPALDYAHTKQVLHRDLKPSNILMDDNGGAYITDFGIARINSEDHGNTITTQGVVGTPSYMSPEQAQGKPLDGRSDVYAMGVMLFEMLTGQRPFQNDTPYSIAVMQVTTPPPSPRGLNDKITPAVEQVILKALKKKPENRYQTATALAESLRTAIERPESIHDTQPRSLPVQEALEVTQPAQLNQQPTLNTPPQVVFTPPPPVYTPSSQPYVSTGLRQRVQRRRRQSSVWVSVVIGGLIGCVLLTVILVMALNALDRFLGSSDNDTPPSSISDVTPGPIGTADPDVSDFTLTLDPVSEAARETLIPRTASTESAPTVLPVGVRTAEPGTVNYPTNGTIVFFAGENILYNIFAYDLGAGRITQITEEVATTSYPQISPDGTQMVYQSFRDGDFEIYIMDLVTGRVRKLTDNGIIDRLPAWSPDGEWIVYSSDTREDRRLDIYRVAVDGSSDPEVLYSDGRRNSHPRYSPDGQSVVFTSGATEDASDWEITVFDLAASESRTLTQNTERDASPSFSPDGSAIIYVTGSGGTNIAVINADGSGRPNVIYEGSGFITGVSYSPDGEHVIFDSQTLDGEPQIFIMRADGTDLRLLENASGLYPSWFP